MPRIPETMTATPGELVDPAGGDGHTLIWLSGPGPRRWPRRARRCCSIRSGELIVETEASGPRRLWIDLAPLAGPARAVVAPWAAVRAGAAVLWHVPGDQDAAYKHVAPVAALDT